jgi:hypothetical protein
VSGIFKDLACRPQRTSADYGRQLSRYVACRRAEEAKKLVTTAPVKTDTIRFQEAYDAYKIAIEAKMAQSPNEETGLTSAPPR